MKLPSPQPSRADSLKERRRRNRKGRLSEWIAAGFLMSKGYRVVARRMKNPLGEIDLIVVRARRIAFVEVKRRATLLDCEAAITPLQCMRIHNAANLWLSRRMEYRDFEIGFDVVYLTTYGWPRHVPNRL